MFKFIISALAIFLFLVLIFGASTISVILRLLFGGRRKAQSAKQQSNQKPHSQDDRIITYKKKEFETSTAEDVEFEEVKDNKK